LIASSEAEEKFCLARDMFVSVRVRVKVGEGAKKKVSEEV
jgi:hypothetical protein